MQFQEFRWKTPVALFLFLTAIVLAIVPVNAKADLVNIPISSLFSKTKLLHVHYDVNADGSYTERGEIRMTILTGQMSQFNTLIPVGEPSFSVGRAGKRNVEILEAYTLKKNGAHISAAPFSQQEGETDDDEYSTKDALGLKTLAFRSVEVGDDLVYAYKAIQSEPPLQNNVVINYSFPRFFTHDDTEISVNAPVSLRLRVESGGLEKAAKTIDGNIQKWVWKYQNIKPEVLQPGQQPTMAHIHVSSFADQAAEIKAMQDKWQLAFTLPTYLAPAPRPVGAQAHPQIDRAMSEALPKSYPRPISEWKTTEKEIYQKLLAGGHFDVLVVPFQVQDFALDRPTRSLMTAELALAMSKAGKAQIPDPYLVSRALGDGDRRLEPSEIYSLADKIGAKKIVWGYVGHDRRHHMSLIIQTQERPKGGTLNAQTPFTTADFEPLAFSDAHPPIETFNSVLPEILKKIGVSNATSAGSVAISRFDETELPASPLDMVSNKRDPARDAYYFQLLAYLTPSGADRTMERFAEKSLLAMSDMSPNSPDYRALKARAFYLLGLRPAALKVLENPATVEEKELIAVLNGNLPDVETLGSQVKPGIRRLLARLDANILGHQYGTSDQSQAAAVESASKLPGKIWPFLAARAYADLDSWSQFDNIHLKQLLDLEFPIKGYTAEGMMRGAAALGDPGKIRTLTDLSVVNHTYKLLDSDAARWCCQTTLGHPAAVDYLNLLEAIGDDNLMRRATFLAHTQGLPEQALDFLNRIESVYKGNPQFAVYLAFVQIKKAGSAEGAEKEGLLKSAYANAFNALYWEQGQTGTSAYAWDLIPSTGQQTYGSYDNFYASDYPYRAYYSTWEHGGRVEYIIPNTLAALNNSTANLRPLNDLYNNWYGNNAQKSDELFKKIEGRFIGNPALSQMRAAHSNKKGDEKSEEKYYREGIRYQPDTWASYDYLGSLLIKQGRLGEATELYMSYPPFKAGSKENPVGIANSAFSAGSRFYWLGETALAVPFYQIADRQQSGSSAEMKGQLRLKLIDGDYLGALTGYLALINRYNDKYAYADYLGMLHAMGASKEAWDAFNLLVNQIDGPEIWQTALTGHRKENKSEAEIATWVKQQEGHDIGRAGNQAAKYLLRAGVTDRIPTQKLAAALKEVELPLYGYSGMVIQPSANGKSNEILDPNRDGVLLPLNTTFKPAPNIRVKSYLVYFVESYRDIRTGNHRQAMASLREAASLYGFSNDRTSFMLPYYAFAAAKTGNAAAIENIIGSYGTPKKGFDYYLARAVISGIGGKTDESVQQLKNALYRRPFTEERPLYIEYQYAEICEWLYEATGKSQYKEMALDWAKKHQKIQPWFAWAYAMEAALSNNKSDRAHAIAMAAYLDPQSEMLSRIQKQERDASIKAFKGPNPFTNMRTPAEHSPI